MAGQERRAPTEDALLEVVAVAKDLQEAYEAYGAVEELLEAQANGRMLALVRRLNDRLAQDIERLTQAAGLSQ